MKCPGFRTEWGGVLALCCTSIAGGATIAGALPDPVVTTATTVSAGRRRMALRVVKVQLSGVRIKVGLAHGLVGRTESLAGISRRYGAVAAINGGYFAAYTHNPIKNPTHTIGTDGQVVHLGNIGSVMFFTADGKGHIGRVPLRINGTLDGRAAWYAYWLNRHPESSSSTVTIFNAYWGKSTGLNDGTQVVVSRGVVTKVGHGSQTIAPDGFVIYFRNQDTLAARFHVGQRCDYSVSRVDGAPDGEWAGMREAVGCGPTLVMNGRVVVDAVGEGFRDPKVVVESTERSAVGLTRDGYLIMATGSGTIRELAVAMKNLGAQQAMNLDGGASSGLLFNGRYLTTPGRELNAGLLVVRK